ncbi:MAG: 16S rRNA pseudouridine(516) synthase [Lachnospiraceae bacterium]|nr:16S rRNA pseudouridine(516) synthase [Lachnospiraceae bacterium]MBQ5485766.1 16S rRNA pseudouridine(516) synthase [Lachnospiraceae bacterium]
MRLDKWITSSVPISRKDLKKKLKTTPALVNGEKISDPGFQVQDEDEVIFEGERIEKETYRYYLLHKPAGYVCATEDPVSETVFSIVPQTPKGDLFTVGRLDKDTEGLLLITNDGALSHGMLSPKKHVAKTYYLKTKDTIPREAVSLFAEGIDIGDEKNTLPAKLDILEDNCSALLTITEGRYHQVKRMMEKVGTPLFYLKRLSMGGFVLEDELPLGAYRKLREDELELVKKYRGDSV